jgi:hypothetical protein
MYSPVASSVCEPLVVDVLPPPPLAWVVVVEPEAGVDGVVVEAETGVDGVLVCPVVLSGVEARGLVDVDRTPLSLVEDVPQLQQRPTAIVTINSFSQRIFVMPLASFHRVALLVRARPSGSDSRPNDLRSG